MRPEPPAPMVLMYHSVASTVDDPYGVVVTPDRFAAQLAWMRRRGLRGVSVGELLRVPDPAGLVGLTFDDGYADFLTEVVPALAGHGWTATVYVLAGALGGANTWDTPGPVRPLLHADDVRRVADAGMEVGSHGLFHRRLTGLDERALADEVVGSRALLEALVGGPVDGFCYPYGDVGPREVDAVRAAGYDHACAVGRPVDAGRHTLARTYVGQRDGGARLAAKWARHGRWAAGLPGMLAGLSGVGPGGGRHAVPPRRSTSDLPTVLGGPVPAGVDERGRTTRPRRWRAVR